MREELMSTFCGREKNSFLGVGGYHFWTKVQSPVLLKKFSRHLLRHSGLCNYLNEFWVTVHSLCFLPLLLVPKLLCSGMYVNYPYLSIQIAQHPLPRGLHCIRSAQQRRRQEAGRGGLVPGQLGLQGAGLLQQLSGLPGM